MTDPSFFGYGSLVNLRTHSYPDARVSKITGWRRVWRCLNGRAHAILSVTRDDTFDLDGIIAAVPNNDWAALDEREALYARQTLPNGTAIYEVQTGITTEKAPILRSYLDVVIQGYHDHFGPKGVADFFATTTNWQPVKDDRAAPLYPRHQEVGPMITALVDDHLAVTVKKLMQPPL